jgi:hypothetical protein
MTTAPASTAVSVHDEQHRLTVVEGLAALSLDALSSVAYGPEAILVVLVAAGAAALRYSLPVTGAIIVLLTVLVVSYRQVIAAFPNGGGAYAVSKAHLGTQASLVAAASLIVDYVLNAAVGVSAGIAALTSAFPRLYGATVWLCLAALLIITGLNLWGVSESARVFTVPTVAFSLGDDVVAVQVCFADSEDEAAHDAFRRQWEEWQPNVPLITLHTTHRSISRPIVKYLCQVEEEDRYHRLVVVIPEVQPPKIWEYLLFNQRGAILDRAIRRGTVNVVLCRLRYRLGQFASGPAAPSALDDDLMH